LLVNPALRDLLLLGADVIGRMPIETIRNTELQAILDNAARSRKLAIGEVEIGGLRPRRFMVHATPLGMFPHANECFFDGDIPGEVVLDMVYNPMETALTRRAASGRRVAHARTRARPARGAPPARARRRAGGRPAGRRRRIRPARSPRDGRSG